MNNIIINGINIKVIKKDIKNIRLSVHPPDGQVRLAVPEKKRVVIIMADKNPKKAKKKKKEVAKVAEESSISSESGKNAKN